MMTYEFENTKTGEIVDLMFNWKEAPSLGRIIRRGGQRLRRIVSRNTTIRKEFKPYITVAKPKGMPGCPVDPKTGRSVITSRAEERRIAKMRGEEWD